MKEEVENKECSKCEVRRMKKDNEDPLANLQVTPKENIFEQLRSFFPLDRFFRTLLAGTLVDAQNSCLPYYYPSESSAEHSADSEVRNSRSAPHPRCR